MYRKTLEEYDVKCCVTVTTVQGLVVSLTPFHNSNNYRSAVLFGHTSLVTSPQEKEKALTIITDHPFHAAGAPPSSSRWSDSRPPSKADIEGTKVIRMKIEVASAKVREGPPKDEKKDVEDGEVVGKFWCGHLVKKEVFVEAVPAPYNKVDQVPSYIQKMITGN
jgi:hypothetical protein